MPMLLADLALYHLIKDHLPSMPDLIRERINACIEAVSTLASDELAWAFDDLMASPHEDDVTLVYLSQQMGLHSVEVLIVALLVRATFDASWAAVLSWLQDGTYDARPSLWLLSQALSVVEPMDIGQLVEGHAVRSGALVIHADSVALAAHTVSVPIHVAMVLLGRRPHVQGCAPMDGHELVLTEQLCEQARCYGEALNQLPDRMLVIRCVDLQEGEALASAVAQSMGFGALMIQQLQAVPALEVWLHATRRVPVFVLSLAPEQSVTLPGLTTWRGPVIVVMHKEGRIESTRTPMQWMIDVPSRHERAQLWGTYLDDEALCQRMSQHRHGPGRIKALYEVARSRAAFHGRECANAQDYVEALWPQPGTFGVLARPVRWQVDEDVLVAPPNVMVVLQQLLDRAHCRETVGDHLGRAAQNKYSPGLKALLVGPSGTGKTLAAGWLASQLRKPLYRVDVASVVSKYIGETEKHLARLLNEAERNDVVLLFDEADSLFSKRTDVQQASDRYANTQTNYLLERLESFTGIALLTSNAESRFDEAFIRRLEYIIRMNPPGPQERRRLWCAHLGDEVVSQLDDRQINQLAVGLVNGIRIRVD